MININQPELLSFFLPKKPKAKPEFCGGCKNYLPHRWENKCRLGINVSARAWSKACKQGINADDRRSGF